jgi:hypothetical protein
MQGRFSVPLPATAPRACVVCAGPLAANLAPTPRKGARPPSPELHPLCPDPACRSIFAAVEGLPDAEFRRQLEWRAQQRRAWLQRLARDRADDARLRQERTEAEAREAAAVFAAVARGADLALTVFSGRGPARPLPERRRRAYAAHLDVVIAAAMTAAEPAAAEAAAPAQAAQAADSSLPGRLCGACGGGCCPKGGDRAFLEAATLRRVMADHPGLDAAGLRALYLDRLPPRPVAGSCVNHTPGGCSLPRSLRSDTCNRWRCLPLMELEQRLDADPPVRTVAVLSRRQNHWKQDHPGLDNGIVGAAILTETGTRRLRPPKPGSGR